MLRAAVAFLLALALSLYVTPIMRRAAIQFGILDHPTGELKGHSQAVPYLGGLAVFVAYLFALGITFDFSHAVLGILLSGTLMLLLGLIDDLGVLSPWEKLAGQTVAVVVLLKAGLYIKLAFLPPPVAWVLTVLWLLTVTNAFNIIDIMDGLASGVGAIAAAFLAAVAIRNGEPMVAVMAAALAGSLCGFLRYNFRPATIYLGDSGSLFIGLTLSSLAMNGHYTSRNSLAMLTPLIILGVPLLDLAFVSAARLRKGLSPFRGSQDHIALRLKRAGLSIPRVVGLAYAYGIVMGIAAIAMMEAWSDGTACLLFAALCVALVALASLLWRTDS
jgi:UDP-GlcNAc:undecaprenyl-phosphate/decaprenyl-phosphate GlcNAc-1-phosphate transferase